MHIEEGGSLSVRVTGEAAEVARAEAQAVLSMVQDDARRSMGENLRRGFALSDDALRLARAFGAPVEVREKPSLPALWRARRNSTFSFPQTRLMCGHG